MRTTSHNTIFKKGIVGLFLLTTVSLSHLSLSAQEEVHKPIIGVMPFSCTNTKHIEVAGSLRDIVNEVFTEKSSRLDVLDRSILDKLEQEHNNQSSVNSIDSKTLVAQGMLAGAENIITGNLSSVSKSSSGVGSLQMQSGKILFSIQSIDVTTGKTLTSKTYTVETSLGTSYAGIGGKSDEQAIVMNAREEIKKHVNSFINAAYPPELKIQDVLEQDKKGLPAKVLIRGGEELGLQKGMTITINSEKMIEGAPYSTFLATLKVSEIKGAFSECKVVKGGDKLESGKADTESKMKMIIN